MQSYNFTRKSAEDQIEYFLRAEEKLHKQANRAEHLELKEQASAAANYLEKYHENSLTLKKFTKQQPGSSGSFGRPIQSSAILNKPLIPPLFSDKIDNFLRKYNGK